MMAIVGRSNVCTVYTPLRERRSVNCETFLRMWSVKLRASDKFLYSRRVFLRLFREALPFRPHAEIAHPIPALPLRRGVGIGRGFRRVRLLRGPARHALCLGGHCRLHHRSHLESPLQYSLGLREQALVARLLPCCNHGGGRTPLDRAPTLSLH